MTLKKRGKNNTPVMYKEIFQQPAVLKRIIDSHTKTGKAIFDEFGGYGLKRLAKARRFIFLGCGTSYHAALCGNYLFEELAELNSEAEFADEFAARDAIIEERTAVVALSQSGETADTVRAAYLAKKEGAFLIAVTGGRKSELARMADAVIDLRAGRERAVAATKTFTAQIMTLALLSVFVSRLHKLSAAAEKIIVSEAVKLPGEARAVLRQDEHLGNIAGGLRRISALAVLGEKLHWPIALEAALKFKEAAYLSAEGFAAREFRHGPLAIIRKGYPCLFFAPHDSVYRDNLRLAKEVGRLGGRVIAVTNEGGGIMEDLARDTIIAPKTLEMFAPVLSAIVAQLLAYHIAVSKGIKVDSPRHLKKVTN